MSDNELRRILDGVISEIDEARANAQAEPRTPRRGRTLARFIAPGVVAVSLALGSCATPLYGVPIREDAATDATADTGAGPAYMVPPVDASLDAEPTQDASPQPPPEADS